MLIEYPDIDERRVALQKLIGVEDRVWVKVGGQPPVYAIADEDLDRENAKTRPRRSTSCASNCPDR